MWNIKNVCARTFVDGGDDWIGEFDSVGGFLGVGAVVVD